MSNSKVYIQENLTEKAVRHLKTGWQGISEFSENRIEFGKETAAMLLKRRCDFVSVNAYIDFMSKYMLEELKDMVERYKKNSYTSKIKEDEKMLKYPIWMCWLQGENQMPEICKRCVERIRHMAPQDAEVIFLTYDNYLTYLDIPEDIVRKHKEGKIGATNYTDIIRYGLLSKYGGAWIDSAVYFTGDILEKAITYEIYSPKFGNERIEDASRGKWIGGVWFSRNGNILFDFTYHSLIYFWRKHNKAVDYLMADYILWIAYTEIEEARRLIDCIPINNENFRLLNNHLYETYNEQLFREITKNNQIHIINRHPIYPPHGEDGKETFYGHLINEKIG